MSELVLRHVRLRALATLASVCACSVLAPGEAELFGGAGRGNDGGAGEGARGGAGQAGGGRSGGGATSAGSSAAGAPAGGSSGGGEGGAPSGTGGAEGGASGAGEGGGVAGGSGAVDPGTGGGIGASGAGGEGGVPGNDPLDALVPRDGLVLWLRADAGVLAADGAVTLWADQSDTGADAVAPSELAAPRLLQTGIGERPALDFDGEDDWLELPDGFEDFSGGLAFFSVFEVGGEEPPVGDCPAILQLSNGRTGQSAAANHISFSRSGTSFSYGNELTTERVGASNVTRREPHLASVVHAEDAARVYLDGTAAAALDAMLLPSTVLRTANRVGKSTFWFDIERECPPFLGKIAEVILFRRPLDSEERLGVERYLSQKYGCCS